MVLAALLRPISYYQDFIDFQSSTQSDGDTNNNAEEEKINDSSMVSFFNCSSLGVNLCIVYFSLTETLKETPFRYFCCHISRLSVADCGEPYE